MQVYACPQRRQSGSKSGGRESGRRNFRLQPKKCPIFRKKCPIFQAKILTRPFFSRQLKKLSFSPKIFTFPLFTPTFLANFSLYLIKETKKDEKRRFLRYF